MALSRQVIPSDGNTDEYAISFADGYLSRDEIKVYEEFLDDTPDSPIDFTFINDYLIRLNRVPPVGSNIVIERVVDASARKVNFIPQYIKSSDLNTMYKHLLYLAQAILDGRWEGTFGTNLDMGGNRIVNVGKPIDDNDAVRLIDISTYTSQAKDLLTQTQASQAAAKVSETNAANSAQQASNAVNGFDANVAQKTQEFNTSAAQKQAAVDASVEEARKWAVGSISEQPQGSAKHWAEEAEKSADEAKGQVIPPQTGQAGKFLTTNGSSVSWDIVNLSTKANTDLSNINANGKSTIVYNATPDRSRKQSIGNGGIAPFDGVVSIIGRQNVGLRVTINDVNVGGGFSGNDPNGYTGVIMAVAKGDRINWYTTWNNWIVENSICPYRGN